MSNIVLDANDQTGLWDKSFFSFFSFGFMDIDKDEIVKGLEDLSKAIILV